MANERKSWETESGLPDDFEGTVVAAKFDTPADYVQGTMIVLVLAIDTPLRQMQQYVSIGAGFSIQDDGRRVVHEEGKGFQQNSYYGRIIERCAKDLGMMDLLQGRGEDTDAQVWVGLRFHWKREKHEFGSGLEEREHLMPVAFLGEVEISEAQAAGAASGTGEEAAPAGSADEKKAAKKAEVKAKSDLKDIAIEADDVATFQDKAMDVEPLPADLLDRVLDDAEAGKLYEELRGE